MGRRVLKFDGPLGRGLWIALGHTFGVRVQKVQRVRPAFGRLVQRVVVSPYRAMSFVIPLRGMENHTTGLRPQSGSPVLSSWHLSFLKASTTVADRQHI